MKRRGTLAKVAAGGVSCVVALALAEGALRGSGLARKYVPPSHIVTLRPDLYQSFPSYGYRLWPSRTTTYRYPEENPRTLTVNSNRHGFRSSREFDDRDPRPRIIVVGDSMVFGEGVEESERFTDQLEKQESGWRVDNLGMTGFGPDLMLRALEQVGVSMRPQVVVLVIYTDDFRRVHPEYAGIGFEIPRFVLRSGQLVTIAYPRAQFWKRWHTVAALRHVMWRASGAEWALNTAIFDRFRQDVAQVPASLVMVFLPGNSETPNDVRRRMWLRDYADRAKVRFLDLTDPILGDRSQSLFIRANWHLNAKGHLVVAQQLRNAVSGLLAIDGGHTAAIQPQDSPCTGSQQAAAGQPCRCARGC